MKKKRYLITFLISAAVLLLLLYGMNLLSSPSQLETVKILSNACAIMGAVLFFFGVILWVDNLEGFRGFKMIVYGTKKFFRYALPFLFQTEIERNYFDYSIAREKEKAPCGHLVLFGGLYLVCSCVLAVVFEALL